MGHPRHYLFDSLNYFWMNKNSYAVVDVSTMPPVSEITKFPYLLPSRHLFSHLIILDVHVTLHHSGTSATLDSPTSDLLDPGCTPVYQINSTSLCYLFKSDRKAIFSTRPTSITLFADTRCSSLHLNRGRFHRSTVCKTS